MDLRPFFGAPSATPTLSDSTRPEDVTLWDFAFPLGMYGEREAAFEITWNASRTDSYTVSVEEIDEVPRARVTSETGPLPIVRGDGSTVFTLVFERLDLRNVQCARADGHATPVAPMLAPRQPLTLPSMGASTASELAAVLASLAGGSGITSWPIELRCHYAYTLEGNAVRVPVVLVAKHELMLDDRSLFEQIESTVHHWLAAAQPPENDARFSFDVAIWSTVLDREEPLLRVVADLPATRP